MKLFRPFIFIALIVGVTILSPLQLLSASNVDELQQKIEERNALIKKLDAEIVKYNSAVGTVSKEAQTLQGAIRELDGTIKTLGTKIKLTETRISSANLTIEQLQEEINTLEKRISLDVKTVEEALRQKDNLESNSLIETLLTYDDLSPFWNHLDSLDTFQTKLREAARKLKDEQADLRTHQEKVGAQKKDLVDFKLDLNDQKKLIEVNKVDKAKILTETKSKESEYKKILNAKIAAKTAFEKELFDFEAQLKVAIDPNSLPSQKSGVLAWPLANIIITQLFGKTVAAARLYTSGSHNGVDFGTPTGSKVSAALSGIVTGTGNSDTYRGCYSFGKWIVVQHPNGLSTLYAHLSLQNVAKGDAVKTGQLIGYSGNTGYSTGPHLHFGVYATAGLKIGPYPLGTYCKGVTLPVAGHDAYLDPILYLPR